MMERGAVLRKYLDTHSSAQVMLALKDNSVSKHKFLKMCNDEICKFLVSEDLESSRMILEKINQIHKSDPTVSPEVKSAFFNNFAAYYEKTDDFTMAMVMADEAIKLDTESHDDIACSVDYNNKTVLLLNLQKYQDAYKCCKRALLLLEPIIFGLIKAKPKIELMKDPGFNSKLYVLLMIYYNLGESQDRLGKREEATECFDQGLKMSEKYLGPDHYFAQKFRKRKMVVGAMPEFSPEYAVDPEPEIEDYRGYYQTLPYQEPFPPLQPEVLEEEIEPRVKRAGRSVKLEPLSEGQDQKDAIIEQLREEKRQKEEELQRLKKAVTGKRKVEEIGKREKQPPSRFNHAQLTKNAFQEEYSSEPSDKQNNKKSFKESSLDPLGNDHEHVGEEEPEMDLPTSPIPSVTIHEDHKAEAAAAAQKEEELKRMQEIQAKTQKEIEEVKKEKERALAELKANNDKYLQEMEAKLFARFQAQQDAEKTKLKEELERVAKLEKEKLQAELDNAKKKLEQKPEPPQKPVSKPPLPKPKLVEEEKSIPVPPMHELKPEQSEMKTSSQDLSESKKQETAMEEELKVEGPEEHLYAKILHNTDHTYKLLVQGRQEAGQKMEIRVMMRCLDSPGLKIKDEVLDESNVQQILTATSLRDVAPYNVMAKGLGSLTSIMKYGVMPFAQIGQEGEDRNIEIWVHAGGIIKDNGLQVTFLGATCHMGLHHIEGEKMRISLTLIDSENGGSLYIDLDYDKVSFMKEFSKTDIIKHKEDPKEEWLPCFEPVPIEFLNHVDSALTEIESYLKRTHRGRFTFEDVAKDPSLRAILVTVRSPNSKQTLWILREKEVNSRFDIYCKTLYDVTISPTKKVPMTRELRYTYDNVWSDYGVDFRSLPLGAQQYFLSEVLKRCVLYIPKEVEESTADDDIQIHLKPLVEANYYRTLVGEKYKYPLTLTLVGHDSELVGVKAVVYNPEKLKETGVFFIADPQQWEYTQEEKDAVPKKKDYQKDNLADYSWLPEKLRRKGYKKIISTIRIEYNYKGEPTIIYTGKSGPGFIEYLENVFVNTKKGK